MSTSPDLPMDAPAPRLCHLIKWPDFEGYGFNLHAERSRSGQFIGKVDDDSPADHAGLKSGDRIVEVNGVNIANENHRQVVERIKSIPSETKLLVVDEEADRWYKERKIVIKSTQPNVSYMKTPIPRPSPTEPPSYENISPTNDTTVVNGVEKKHVENGLRASTDSPKFEVKSNGVSHEDEEQTNHIDSSSPSKKEVEKEESPKLMKTVVSQSPKHEEETNSRSSTPLEGNGSIPDSPHSSKSSRSSGANSVGSNSNHNGPSSPDASGPGTLNLNMSASEMRQMLASRKKKDPKKVAMDIRQKYEIVQQM